MIATERRRHRPANAYVASEQALVRRPVAFVKEELQVKAVRVLDVNFVNRWLEPLARCPFAETMCSDFRDASSAQVRSQILLVVPQDSDVQIGMGPRLAIQEEIDRPTPGDAPRSAVPGHHGHGAQDLGSHIGTGNVR